ncbi:MAG: lysophospholipid acyltransferase family protein [Marinifilaceae bacterium]
MKAAICKRLLHLGGWRFVGEVPTEKKAVIIAVPHTSNWDFVWGKLAFLSEKVSTTIIMKKELFVFPLGGILRSLGVMPIDRSKSSNLVEQLAQEFARRDSLYLSLAPEGSRSKRPVWKRGFYYIALGAKVPIFLGKIDYKNKTLTLSDPFYPTGDVEADMKKIKGYYRDCNPKFPDKFSLGEE